MKKQAFMLIMHTIYSTKRNERLDEDDAFGWQLFHDRQRNLIYYLHSYTGEVRWPRPETVGFVMHGLKPLPAYTGIDARMDSSILNPDVWSPYYPHVVMLPSGLVQVHPGPNSETQGATEMWCGYNRFPLTHSRVSQALSEPHRTKKIGQVAMLASEPRMLPPTWEESRSGSPFLPPYPVAILKRDDTEAKCKAAPRPPPYKLDERFHTPAVDVPPSYFHLKHGEFGRVHGSLDWPTIAITSQKMAKVPVPRQPACAKGIPVPNTEKKEHNRKGYLLRQARKMMRESGANSTATTLVSTSKQRKDRDTTSTTTTRLERPLEDNQDSSSTYDALLSPHC